jgi:hypothetical protein
MLNHRLIAIPEQPEIQVKTQKQKNHIAFVAFVESQIN